MEEKKMKKQYDVCLIYLSYVFEIIGLLIFVYFFMMIKKVVSKECIDLKRNTFLLFGLLVIDLVMYHFSIMTMFHYSSAITFMCVGLIINMVLYLKYRTYLINN